MDEQFKPGGLVLHRGKAYILRSDSRESESTRQYVDLEDPETGSRFSVPSDEAYLVPLSPDGPPSDIPQIPRSS